MLETFLKLKSNYDYLSANLSGYTKSETICIKIGFVGFLIYFLQQVYGLQMPTFLIHIFGIGLLCYAYAMLRANSRNFKECYMLLFRGSFPVQGRFYVYGSVALKMAPKGLKYFGGAIGLAGGINYLSVEFFEISPVQKFSKYVGWYKEPLPIQDKDKLIQDLIKDNEKLKKIVDDIINKKK